MKKIILSLVLCLVLVGLTASPAFAATQRVDLGKFAGPGNPLTKVGYATFITNQGDQALVVGITLTSALVKTKYEVHLITEPFTEYEEDYILGTLTTNSKGKWGGQNEQYQFEQLLSAGQHTVSLILIALNPDGTPKNTRDWINSMDERIINISKN